MKRSQRKRQRQIAEHSMKPKNGDGRWRTILRGQNPSEQTRNAEKKKQEIMPNSRQEENIDNCRQEKSKEICEKPKADHEESVNHTEDLHTKHKVNEEFTKT